MGGRRQEIRRRKSARRTSYAFSSDEDGEIERHLHEDVQETAARHERVSERLEQSTSETRRRKRRKSVSNNEDPGGAPGTSAHLITGSPSTEYAPLGEDDRPEQSQVTPNQHNRNRPRQIPAQVSPPKDTEGETAHESNAVIDGGERRGCPPDKGIVPQTSMTATPRASIVPTPTVQVPAGNEDPLDPQDQRDGEENDVRRNDTQQTPACLLYTSDAADD